MDLKMIKIIAGLVALAGCAYGVYKYEQNNLLSKVLKVKIIDVQFVKDWISNQDFEKYNKSYTAVMLRGNELPDAFMLKLFFDLKKITALCIYDKNSKSIVTKDFFMSESIADELGSDDFIEFPFE